MNTDPKDQSAQPTQQTNPVQNQAIQPQNAQQDGEDQSREQPAVSVPVGGSEGAPAHVETTQSIEKYVQPSDVEPQVSAEVAEYVQLTPRPKIHADAQAAGLKESIPQGPVYGNLPTDQNTAMQTFKTGDSSLSNTWRALVAIKEFARGLLSPKKPEEAN